MLPVKIEGGAKSKPQSRLGVHHVHVHFNHLVHYKQTWLTAACYKALVDFELLTSSCQVQERSTLCVFGSELQCRLM
jgi:hypothetical protein